MVTKLKKSEMKTARIFWRVLYFVSWLTVSSAQTSAQNLYGHLCEDGWYPFLELNGAALCIKIIKIPLPWLHAKEYCQREIAHLINMDPVRDMYILPIIGEALPIYMFRETGGEFWSGMHVQNGKLMWEAYGPEFVKTAFRKSWSWGPLQPSISDGKACGKVVQGRRIIKSIEQPPLDGSGIGELSTTETPPTTTVRVEFNGKNLMELSACTDALPFVCQKPTIQDYVRTVSYCPEDWLGSPYIPYCFRIVKAPLPHLDAKKACKGTYGGEMIQATPNSFNATLSTFVLRYYLVNDTYFWNSTLPTAWIDGGPVSNGGGAEPDKCYAVIEEIRKRLRVSTDQCVNPHPFICVRPTVRQVSSSDGGLDGLTNLINEDGNEMFVNFNQLYFTTGYYSFGVYTINPPSYVETNPILVRFSEQDWFIYVITVDVFAIDLYVRPGISRQFNLYNNGDSIGSLDGVFSNSATRMTPTVNENIPTSIRTYRADRESISGNTIKFRAFMNVFGSRSFGSEMEQTMLLVVQEHWKDNLPFTLFVKSSLNVRSTIACPTEEVTINGELLTFPSIRSGETAFSWERCIGGDGAFASRSCHGGYDNGVTWGEIVPATGCEAFPTLPESPSTADLKNLSEVILNATNFNQVLNDTIRLTAPDVNLTEADIIYTAEILYNFLSFDVVQPTILGDIYEITNNVLERIPEIINAAQTITNAANRIIKSVEEITSNAGLLGMKSLRVTKSFLATNIWDQDGIETPIIGLKFHKNDDDDNDDTLDNMDLINVETPSDTDPYFTDTAIYLDPELFKGRPTRAVYQIYSRTTLFEKDNSRFELISKVAAARLEVDNILITDLGNNFVVVIFRPSKNDDRTVCAFWDYRADEGAGDWATDGCNKTLTADKRVMCQCNHLTNFAVLIDLKAYTISDTDKVILEIVTKVGLIISIIGLGLHLLTYIIFKHLRSGRGQQVLVNLAVSMICSAIIFLVGMDKTETVVGCKVVAALLHYFILVSFMWMLVEGILQYLRFVKVLGTYIPKFMLKTMIPAWGIPILPVVIVATVDHDLYYGGNGYCWLARDAMLYGFIVPVAIIMFANVIVFCLVMVNLLRRRSNFMKSNQSESKMAYLHFQAAVSIFVVLGLTWVFGFLAIDGARIVFHYIFSILNAFQGFFIFLLFTVREQQIRKAWRNICCKDKAGKLGSSSTGTDVPQKVTRSSDATHSNTSSNGNSENGHHERNIEFNNIGYEPY